jgi:hypothetical protein
MLSTELMPDVERHDLGAMNASLRLEDLYWSVRGRIHADPIQAVLGISSGYRAYTCAQQSLWPHKVSHLPA